MNGWTTGMDHARQIEIITHSCLVGDYFTSATTSDRPFSHGLITKWLSVFGMWELDNSERFGTPTSQRKVWISVHGKHSVAEPKPGPHQLAAGLERMDWMEAWNPHSNLLMEAPTRYLLVVHATRQHKTRQLVPDGSNVAGLPENSGLTPGRAKCCSGDRSP